MWLDMGLGLGHGGTEVTLYSCLQVLMSYLVADCCHMQLSECYAVIAGMVQLTVCSAVLNVRPLIPLNFPEYGILHKDSYYDYYDGTI